MSAIKIIGKLNPKQYSEMLDHLTRKKIKNPFIKAKDIVVNKKPEVEQREMFNRFNQANPRQDMAGGGMLVQPGFGGTRQGYSDGPKMTMVREYLTNLPKKSKVAPVDLSKELEVDRKLIDNALKEKKFKNKFNVVRKKDALTGEEFIK